MTSHHPDNIFTATSISKLLIDAYPADQKCGYVHSVFSVACNFRFDGKLVTIADVSQKNLPYGILCHINPHVLSDLISSGEEVTWDRQGIQTNQCLFLIDRSRIKTWLPDLHLPTELSNYKQVRSHVQVMIRAIHTRGISLKKSSLVYGENQYLMDYVFDQGQIHFPEDFKDEPLAQLITGLAEKNCTKATRAIERKLGVGIGLTPSYDDFFIGLMGTLASLTKGPSRSFYRSVCHHIYQLAKDLTNDISITFFEALKDGYISERFQNLIRSALVPSEYIFLKPAITQMLQFGETSGIETILGFLTGLSILMADSDLK